MNHECIMTDAIGGPLLGSRSQPRDFHELPKICVAGRTIAQEEKAVDDCGRDLHMSSAAMRAQPKLCAPIPRDPPFTVTDTVNSSQVLRGLGSQAAKSSANPIVCSPNCSRQRHIRRSTKRLSSHLTSAMIKPVLSPKLGWFTGQADYWLTSTKLRRRPVDKVKNQKGLPFFLLLHGFFSQAPSCHCLPPGPSLYRLWGESESRRSWIQ